MFSLLGFSNCIMDHSKHCERCQAPMFLNQTNDWFGNSVATLNCWNGHYSWIKIEDIEESNPVLQDIAEETKPNPVVQIGFFSLK